MIGSVSTVTMTANQTSNSKPRLSLPVRQGLLPFDKVRIGPDIMAGITLAALGIPEVMGYTKIIGTPVIAGRFTTCVLQSGIEMPYRAIQTNIAEALNIVIQIERQPSIRFVSEIVSIERYDPDNWRYDFHIIYQR